MNYDVATIPPFDKQLKRLAKKFPSLKKDFAKLIETLETTLSRAHHSVIIVIRYALQLALKEKGKVAVQELSAILLLKKPQFFCFPFMINQKSKTLLIRSYRSC